MLSLTQTYFLAHSSRQKLSKEAARPDHDLRLLVGHANMLDALMVDLASAEQEQERWFNKSVSGAKSEEEPTEEWAETIVEERLEDAESSDDESEADEDESEDTIITTTEEVDSDDEYNSSDLALTRTHSHSRHSPPELSSDSDSESEDEHMPPSPPQPTFSALTDKQRAAIATTSYYESKDTSLSPTEQEAFQSEGFFLPQRQQSTLIAAY